jgi:ParB family transcriptional regulator, chromosome partitioning protein
VSNSDRLDRLGADGNMDKSLTVRRGRPDAGAAPASPASNPQYKGVVRSKTSADIEVVRIVRDPKQPRQTFDEDELDNLVASFRKRGQLQPARVRWDPAQEVYVLISGERRWRAAKLAGFATLKCEIHEGVPDEAELRVIQLTENTLREDMQPLEQAQAFKDTMALEGWSATRLAEELGVSQPTVTRALKLLELPEHLRAKVSSGDLSPSAAYELARVGDAGEQAALADQVVAGDLTRDELAVAVRQNKEGRGEAAPGPRRTRTRHLIVVGQDKVTVSGPSVAAGPRAVEEALERALEQHRAAMRAGLDSSAVVRVAG